MKPPLTPENVRATRAGGKSRTAVARAFGLALSTFEKILDRRADIALGYAKGSDDLAAQPKPEKRAYRSADFYCEPHELPQPADDVVRQAVVDGFDTLAGIEKHLNARANKIQVMPSLERLIVAQLVRADRSGGLTKFYQNGEN